MLTEKEAFAALLARAKLIVIENFDFDKAIKAMRAIEFGWVAHHDDEDISLGMSVNQDAEFRLSNLIDSAISAAVSLVNTGKPWGITWTASSGFIVFVSEDGIIMAHMSLVNADSYDCEELHPLYAQLDAVRLGAPQPTDNFNAGRQRRILMLNG